MKLDHSIHLHSIRNARELGGYITADGRRVKSGVLLRTAMLNGISDEDIRLLTKVYRLAHIVDFRMDMELSAAEDPPIDGAGYRPVVSLKSSAAYFVSGSGTKADPYIVP
jgi:protein-tyrosine phosphatase